MTKNIISNRYYIKCYPKIDIHFKSKYVSKIVGKLEYWFDKPKFRNGFFKFLEPCKHYGYKEGDSWTEEIGISRRVFNAAFQLIGTSYNSKSSFMAQEDPFQGKIYAKYYDRKLNKTHFFKNHAIAQQFFSQFVDYAQTRKFTPHNYQPVDNYSDSNINSRSRNQPNDRSFITNKYKQINISSYDKNFELEEKMHAIWIEETGSRPISKISLNIAKQLQNCWTYFNQSLEKWRIYCQKIASSKFLMGEKEGSKFKAWFSWIIKISTIEDIESGIYTLGDRLIKLSNQTKDLQQQAEKEISQYSTLENREFHKYLLNKGGIQDYYRWFKYLTVNATDINSIVIKTINRFMRDSIENRFDHLIREAVNYTFNTNKPYKMIT